MAKYDYDEEDQDLEAEGEDFEGEELSQEESYEERENSKSRKNEDDDDDDLEDLIDKNSSEEKFSMAKEDSAQETATTIRNFRQSADIEGFYRFVDEHGLRKEAHQVFDKVVGHLSKKKKKSKNS